jgi:hypothetical protein
LGSYSRKTSQDSTKTQTQDSLKPSADKKTIDGVKSKHGDDNLSALKSYRRAKGLCFKCGEKWGPQHTCPPQVSINAIEEIWKWVADESIPQPVQEDSDFGDDLMALSLQALNGIEGVKTIRLRGHLADKEMFMLVDSGSTDSFINEHLAKSISSWHPLAYPISVKVANGEVLQCTHQLPQQIWDIQGHTFKTTLKIIPLRGYDVILGMDWLEAHSPMEVHWADKWLQFTLNNKTVKLHGIKKTTL